MAIIRHSEFRKNEKPSP